jgi:hypothetical protein
VQRHRHDGIGLCEQLAAGMRHPSAHGWGQVEPVTIFQGMNQLARDIVVTHRCPRAAIGRRIGNGLHGEKAGPAVEREGNAKAFAIGRPDERELGPASRTQTRTDDRFATGGAKLR